MTEKTAPLDIAIVGIGLKIPGADTPGEFWQNLVKARDISENVSPERWVIDSDQKNVSKETMPDKVRNIRGYFAQTSKRDLSKITQPLGLDMKKMDPLFSMSLEAAVSAVEDASFVPSDRCGVVMASIALPTDTASTLCENVIGKAFENKLLNKDHLNLSSNNINIEDPLNGEPCGLPALLIARALGFKQGAYTLDAACASSLVAVELACRKLRQHKADAMLAGGLSRPSCLYTQMGFSALFALSKNGVCRPFDKKADGLMVGEGCALVLLKRLEDAVKSKDKIYGVIKSVGLSNDIEGSLVAPSSEGQLRSLKTAYEKCGLKPEDIDYIECHGTGTPVGDKVELTSLTKLWEGKGCKGQCAISSVKSMIGHLLTAAGAAGLIKVLLCLKNGKITPQVNFDTPIVDLSNTPFRIPTAVEDWKKRSQDVPRRAAVSGFGFGGINAHLIIEQWDGNLGDNVAKANVKTKKDLKEDNTCNTDSNDCEPLAVVGLACQFGSLKNASSFKEAILAGEKVQDFSPDRFWHLESLIKNERAFTESVKQGTVVGSVELPLGKFRIPPNDIPDLLPQQSLLLNCASKALEDAKLPIHQVRLKAAAIIGLGLDLNSTNYNLRWALQRKIEKWSEELGLSQSEKDLWLEDLRQEIIPHLDSSRTMGALGSIVASRVAREFLFGGASYAVSDMAGSGLTALEIASSQLRSKDLDLAVVGAVDLAADIRRLVSQKGNWGPMHPLDRQCKDTICGEGAGCIVLKRLKDAQRDKDHIYCLIRSVGSASRTSDESIESAYIRSMEDAYSKAKVDPQQVSFVETAAIGQKDEDLGESKALFTFFNKGEKPLALGTVSPIIGNCGNAFGLASLIKAAICLDAKLIPGMANYKMPLASDLDWDSSRIHMPIKTSFWIRNKAQGPRFSGVSSFSPQGSFTHAVLEGWEDTIVENAPIKDDPAALFPIYGDNVSQLKNELVLLKAFAKEQAEKNIQQQVQKQLQSQSQFKDNNKSFTIEKINREPQRKMDSLNNLAYLWHKQSKAKQNRKLNLTIVIEKANDLLEKASLAEEILNKEPNKANELRGIYYNPAPLAKTGKTAFVYPGSGVNYIGMGQEIGARFPSVMDGLDKINQRMADQFMTRYCQPYISSWSGNWKKEAYQILKADTHKMMFSQVSFGVMMTDLVRLFGFEPQSAIGYSLGESTAMFSLRAWPHRDTMLCRMEESDLFRKQLSGPCLSIRKAWNIPEDVPFEWSCATIIGIALDTVKEHIAKTPNTRLLIINTETECVVGGESSAIKELTESLGAESIIISGVDTVHCDALSPVKDRYRAMHTLPTNTIKGVDFYSGNKCRSYPLTSESIADSIVSHGEFGIDYVSTIRQAYADGVRVFIELGPSASCTRMIRNILKDKQICAVSADVKGRNGITSLIHMLAGLTSCGFRPDFDVLYTAAEKELSTESALETVVKVPLGHKAFNPQMPKKDMRSMNRENADTQNKQSYPQAHTNAHVSQKTVESVPNMPKAAFNYNNQHYACNKGINSCNTNNINCNGSEMAEYVSGNLINTMYQASASSYAAYSSWLNFATITSQGIEELVSRQAQIMQKLSLDPTFNKAFNVNVPQAPLPLVAGPSKPNIPTAPQREPAKTTVDDQQCIHMISGEMTRITGGYVHGYKPSLAPKDQPVRFTREQCLEFALGKIGSVLGPKFAQIDSHPSRVRLPGEPLMLVDRILSIDGEPLSLGSGRLVTEHDVVPGMWYLDGGRAPVFLSVEAGQADLFLCGWLGIDLKTKGKRVYRLVDATVSFHRGLPVPGETVRYDISINRFVRQGDTWLFFFEYEATINGETFLTMRNGCAGFFTYKEINENGGLVLTEMEMSPKEGKKDPDAYALTPLYASSYDNKQVECLRKGDLVGCFGEAFAHLPVKDPVHLPGGLLRLIHRVPKCDPFGGRWHLGIVCAEADVHPDDWFLTCHFVDDMVMPGTLMYECCAHALRFFLLRLGWVAENDQVAFEPVIGVKAVLKCRGPVLQTTKTVVYQVEIREIGYRPEPYVIADAIMYADGKRIVGFQNLSMRITGTNKNEINRIWRERDLKAASHKNNGHNPLGTISKDYIQSVITEMASLPLPNQKDTLCIKRAKDIGPSIIPMSLKPGEKPEKKSSGALYDAASLLQFAWGRPSLAYGKEFAKFDNQFIARLPGPPYQFLSRIISVDHPFMKVQPAGWVEAEYDVPKDAWYFTANHQETMPFCVLLEIPLQACGWLSAYAGSSAKSNQPLQYRNLGGTAVLKREVFPNTGTLSIKVRMTKASEAGGLIIQSFQMWMGDSKGTIYEGDTTFGFFSHQAMSNQVGVRGVEDQFWIPKDNGLDLPIIQSEPMVPKDTIPQRTTELHMPGGALMMLDNAQWFEKGGHLGLGFVKGTRKVNKNEWFFRAHFYQDPVIPGSLGLESFLELLKRAAIHIFPDKVKDHQFEAILTGEEHTWIYRGQVIPDNDLVTVEADITEIRKGDEPCIKASGFLKVDGKTIYQMQDFGIRLRKVK